MSGLKLFVEAIRDFFWPISPKWIFQNNHIEPAFAFLVHPRGISDVYRKYPFSRIFSPRVLKWLLRHFWPVILSEVTGLKSHKNGLPIRGWVLTIPLTAEQMISDRQRAVRLISKAIKLAYCRGANIVGLGALNASITFRGRDLKNLIDRLNMGITSGVGYTAYNIVDLALYLSKKFKLNISNSSFGIVGAAGAIASATLKYLLTKGARNFILIDIDRKHMRINEIIDGLKINYPDAVFHVTSNLFELKKSRFVITATNVPDALIKNEHLSSGTIVIDDAQPSDIDESVINNREDVLVIEGGVIEVRGINPHFNFGLKHKTDVFSCLAEAMVLAAHGRFHEQNFDYSSPEEIEKIGKQGAQLGFSRAELQNFCKVYSEADLESFKNHYLFN